jgi:RNA polymerase sigma-70 factor (ECF subfamily)
MIAALTRRFGAGRLALIENAAQDACVRALERWSEEGVPAEAERWLVRVAHNALIDALRRQRPLHSLDEGADIPEEPPEPDSDDELRLAFLCCDPQLSRAAQVALVLNVIFGLTAQQIAGALLSDERTVAQRIVRAKQRMREAGLRFSLPDESQLPARLSVVLDVLYMVFSEGYNPTCNDLTLDAGLCNEALRLIRVLTAGRRTARPACFALRAVLCLHVSRLPARLADDGSLLLIQEQDRARWDTDLIQEAFQCLARAGRGEELSRFHIEAGIAACHAMAPTWAGTDWVRIVELYDMLRQHAPSLVIDVNRALAIGMCRGARAGLDELDAIPEREILGRYPYALAAYADLHASLGELPQARAYLDRALCCQSAPAQQALLARKRAALQR